MFSFEDLKPNFQNYIWLCFKFYQLFPDDADP
jgi:hypothetical protein